MTIWRSFYIPLSIEKGRAVLYSDLVTILRMASMQYIPKLASDATKSATREKEDRERKRKSLSGLLAGAHTLEREHISPSCNDVKYGRNKFVLIFMFFMIKEVFIMSSLFYVKLFLKNHI